MQRGKIGGWGAVVAEQNGTYPIAVTNNSNSNELDNRTILESLERSNVTDCELLLLMDNAAAVHVLRNNSAKTIGMQVWNDRIYAAANSRRIVLWVCWIPTEANVADGLSRVTEINHDELTITKRLAEEWLGGEGGSRTPCILSTIYKNPVKEAAEMLQWDCPVVC